MSENTTTTPQTAYPEHDKQRKVLEASHQIGDFLEWLTEQHGVVFGRYREGSERLWPAPEPIDKLLAAYFDIDLDKIEDEKRAMLEALRHAVD